MNMSEKKIYSVLLAWNMNNMEEGTYGVTVDAKDYEMAVTAAQEAMFNTHCDEQALSEEDEAEERAEGIPDYQVLDLHEGANIWAAPAMLGTLRKMQEFLLAYPASAFSKREQDAHVTACAEVNDAIRAGEKLQ
jgi:hypothetical protein